MQISSIEVRHEDGRAVAVYRDHDYVRVLASARRHARQASLEQKAKMLVIDRGVRVATYENGSLTGGEESAE